MGKIKNFRNSRKEKKIKKNKEKLEMKEKKEKERKLKLENRKVERKFIEFSQLLDIDDNNNILLKEGLLDIFRLNSIDISGMNEYESHGSILSFTSLLKKYHENMKVVAMNFPTDTSVQKRYLQRKMKSADTESKFISLQKSYRQLLGIEQYRSDRQYYLFIFADNEKEMNNRRTEIISAGRKMGIERVDIEKKIKILYKLNNMNSKIM